MMATQQNIVKILLTWSIALFKMFSESTRQFNFSTGKLNGYSNSYVFELFAAIPSIYSFIENYVINISFSSSLSIPKPLRRISLWIKIDNENFLLLFHLMQQQD